MHTTRRQGVPYAFTHVCTSRSNSRYITEEEADEIYLWLSDEEARKLQKGKAARDGVLLGMTIGFAGGTCAVIFALLYAFLRHFMYLTWG